MIFWLFPTTDRQPRREVTLWFPPEHHEGASPTANLNQADALLFGRVTYEMMESAWRPPAPTGAASDRVSQGSSTAEMTYRMTSAD